MVTNDVTRLVTRWLEHATYGLGAVLAGLPRARPGGGEDPLPVVPAIYNDVDTEGIAGGELDPPTSPALIVYTTSGVRFRPQTEQRRELVPNVAVIIAYATIDVAPSAAVRDGGYVLRAAHESVRRLNDQRAAAGYRAVNGVAIRHIGAITENAVAGSVGRAKLWGFLLVPVLATYEPA